MQAKYIPDYNKFGHDVKDVIILYDDDQGYKKVYCRNPKPGTTYQDEEYVTYPLDRIYVGKECLVS